MMWARHRRSFKKSMTTTKDSIVKEVSDITSLTQKDVRLIINAFLEVIMRRVSLGEVITFLGFGTFKSRLRSARPGRNPLTGEPLNIPEKQVPVFSPGEIFKKKVSPTEEEKQAA